MEKRKIRQVWKHRVEQWKRSGLTAQKFAAKKAGVNAATLKWWKWQLGREARARVTLDAIAASAPPRFIEVAAPAPEPRLSEGTESVFVLELEDGPYRIRVAPAFDAAGLRRLLAVLEGE